MAGTTTPSGASISDVLTAIQNIVKALNNATQTYLSVNGTLNAANIAGTTLVKSTAGRIATVSVLTAGTTVGLVYDSATLTGLTKPLGVIPNTVGTFALNLPISFGLLVVPGAGQVVTVGYS
jgi:hypothetical protein